MTIEAFIGAWFIRVVFVFLVMLLTYLVCRLACEHTIKSLNWKLYDNEGNNVNVKTLDTEIIQK